MDGHGLASVIHRAASDPVLPGDVTARARDLGPLESPLIWLGFASAAVAVLAVVVALWYRRRVRRWGFTAFGVLLLVAAVTALNSYVGYVRTSDDLARLLQRGPGVVNFAGRLLDDGSEAPSASSAAPRPAAGAAAAGQRIDVVNLPDPAHGVPSGSNYVILPPGYDSDPARRYPVVYLIHGYPFGGPRDWLTSGDAPGTLQALEKANVIAPMIVVSVDMTAGNPSTDWECLNVPGGPQLESYLAGTVVPGIDQRYRTLADRTHRALGGMSGGGFGALNIGLHHVDEFATLVIALPYDDLNDSVGILDGNRAAIAANTPRRYLPTMRFSAPISVMLAVGTGAPTDVATARRIADALHARGQEAVVHAERGFNHTWHTARATLPYLLAFADQEFRTSPAAS
ncbi:MULTISPECIES: alpha/beta hydrolase-fold protein [unclassified Amycolatopsis]|uniref:alpha/beta hydrolase n=1 Tax=unclassified Amycolatopsis TaxID=2618356 RepID=UPI002875FD43|nr:MULTISPECIES: alpha/beta hydrolase-fold protein [unclassified Amycolatopsis]MDS0136954.1 esterase [Amycolatopsis sp. 505]MDS0143619.1 esterase [Amycolatopsis sp. CM201R]